jgi:putative membrane-bound dehydrogenase-like protein
MNNKQDNFKYILFLMIIFITACTGEQHQDVNLPPLDSRLALESIEVMDGFRVELFASEPLVQDPAAMEVDEFGRIYVVEMRGYPLNASGLGRVKLLEDTNGDGYPDNYTIFADSLAFPKGIMRWKSGVLVTDAPNLYYLEDSTGDGKADIKEVILTGFARSNPQHNFNTPIYGLDNWIHLANGGTIWTETYNELFGDRGSEVHFYGVDDATVLPQNAAGRNVRFRPDSHEIENRSAWSQFGHTFDAWGRHFLISNAHHHFHEAIAKEYVNRNPALPLRSAIHYTPGHGNAAEVYPVTINPEHQLLTDIGIFTSASGITWYLGGAFPEPFDQITFVAESVHNLVHADIVEPDGAVFKTRRLNEEKEFIASKDSWFRPVQFYIGPDGALYVIDYYRRIIEHPQWMDDEIVASEDLYESTQRGRIYRVVPDDMDSPGWTSNLDLGNRPAAELVEYLESNNIWWRRNAQRLLVDRQETDIVTGLIDLLYHSERATARLHALWTLDGLDRLEDDLIIDALSDESAGVRENAIKLAEKRISPGNTLTDALYTLQDDPSMRVRYQLILTLGELSDPESIQAREEILFRDLDDPWIQIAYLSAREVNGQELLTGLLDRLTIEETPGRRLFFSRLSSTITGEGNDAEIGRLLRKGLTDIDEESYWWKSAILDGLTETFPNVNIDINRFSDERELALNTFFNADQSDVRESVVGLIEILGVPVHRKAEVLEKAASVAADKSRTELFRADAIRLISMIDPESFEEQLLAYSRPDEPSVVQQEAVRGLGKIPGSHIAEYLLENWGSMTPVVRDRAVDAMMEEDDRIMMLLDAVEENRVLVSTVGWGRRVVLMRDTGGELRDRARELLREDPEQRREVLEQYREVLVMIGNQERGREIFRESCAMCHQVREQDGIAFGPDLATVRHWPSTALISKILDPNRSIADGYEMWVIERSTGPGIAGVIVGESTGAVTVRNAGGVETIIPRSQIESIEVTNVSAMPSGMENEIDRQQMADLIAFIRSL